MMQPHAQYMVSKRLEEKRQKYQDLSLARDISRKAILAIITLSSAIIGATFTLYSIPNIEERFDVSQVTNSWSIFMITIALGLLYLLVDGRLLYLETWEEVYTREAHVIPEDKRLRKLARKYLLLSFLWSDFRDKGYSKVLALTNEISSENYSIISGYYLRRFRSVVLAAEFLVYALFVVGLASLVFAF